ncbi:hypothetical protein ACE6H2_016668 [Prunus campanulata]
MAVDRITRRPKGFGFVTYKSDVEAQKALKAMNGLLAVIKKGSRKDLVLLKKISFWSITFKNMVLEIRGLFLPIQDQRHFPMTTDCSTFWSSRFAKLPKIQCQIAGRNLYIRFACSTRDAMAYKKKVKKM